MCPNLGWNRSQLHHVPHLHINVFFTAHVSSFMTLSEVTFVSLFLSRLENHCTLKYFANVFWGFFQQHLTLLGALVLHLQTCMDKHQVVGVLRQMEKFLKGQEMRFTEGLRIMKSKLATLQNSVSKMPQADQSAGECTFNHLIMVTLQSYMQDSA